MSRKLPKDTDFDRESFQKYLDEYLNKKDISRSQASTDWGFERSYLRKIYNGESKPSKKSSDIICEKLGVPVDFFFVKIPQDHNEVQERIITLAGLLKGNYQESFLYTGEVLYAVQRREEEGLTK